MSKSRLEKFLYALYSLDSSDLPNPLSRIEELYKCLVTGDEAPTFEPISRVEKYLMAILGGYDVELLPNPLSRVEVLLYKLATGDDNLDDIKSFLSEHEELLAEIIRNGGVGGNIDIEYVLYTLSTEFNTLYNTAKKPVKSAILKGQTLVNYMDLYNWQQKSHTVEINNDTITIQVVDGQSYVYAFNKKPSTIKPNTKYLVSVEVLENTFTGAKSIELTNGGQSVFKDSGITISDVGKYNFILTTRENIDDSSVLLRTLAFASNGEGYIKYKVMVIEYQEGMENWIIPYFEGMQSVKMPVLTTTGKNVFNPNWLINEDTKHAVSIVDGNVILNGEFTRSITWFEFKLPKGTYKATNFNTSDASIHVFWRGVDALFTHDKPFTYDTETTVKGYILKGTYVNHVLELQVESGTEQSTYEPFKSNILTTNEEVELRGVGDVHDKLDLLTGELTKRIGEIVLDGSEEWILSSIKNNTQVFNLAANNSKLKNVAGNGVLMCDKLKVASGVDDEIINFTSSLYIALLKSKISTVAELKVYLSQNPITFIHKLAKESVKTVDLSTVNQDGNNTKLSTFNDITHVTLSSEGLIPEAELEVATKNEEVLSTLSLEMDDIFATQTTLGETTNTQSENVDATMIATTEIYEGLL